jgi:hypothetical protein
MLISRWLRLTRGRSRWGEIFTNVTNGCDIAPVGDTTNLMAATRQGRKLTRFLSRQYWEHVTILLSEIYPRPSHHALKWSYESDAQRMILNLSKVCSGH